MPVLYCSLWIGIIILYGTTAYNGFSPLKHSSSVYSRRSNFYISSSNDDVGNESANGNKVSKGFQTQQSSQAATSEAKISTNKVLKPSLGKKGGSAIEKFLMMYTCKICLGRNAQMVRIVLSVTTSISTQWLLDWEYFT